MPIELLARAVVVVDGKLLLCRGKKSKITYLPGGHIDPGEGARAAVWREIEEELGMKATVGRFLGAIEHAFIQKDKPVQEMNVVFAVEIAGLRTNEPPKAQEHWIGFEWAALDGLDAANLEPAPLRTLIPKWLRDGAGWGSTME